MCNQGNRKSLTYVFQTTKIEKVEMKKEKKEVSKNEILSKEIEGSNPSDGTQDDVFSLSIEKDSELKKEWQIVNYCFQTS